MSFDVKFTITGLQKAQERNLRRIAALKPSGTLGKAVQAGSLEAHRRWTIHTPHEWGALRASRRVRVEGLRATIYDDPSATNPRSGGYPSRYDVFLHARGEIPGIRSGIQASAPYTRRTEGPRILRMMADQVKADLK